MRILILAFASLLLFPLLHGENSKEAAAPKTIGIFTFAAQGLVWDPESIKTGITGSEEAVIYVSEKLVDLGYRVTVFGNPPEGSKHSLPTANPRFIKLDTSTLIPRMDIAISWRMPQLGVALKNYADKVYLWLQDTCAAPLTPEQLQSFNDVLWISAWQREQWISMNPSMVKFTQVSGNAINPEQFGQIQPRKNPYSCIYASNYSRGLEVLLNLWPTIKRQFPKATLDVYYGWQHWGTMTPEKEMHMKSQMESLKNLDVRDHGLVNHEELNKAYSEASFWTYPCIAPETFCITGIRAQLSGAVPVIISGSGLKETVLHGYQCADRSQYLKTLIHALQHAEEISIEDRKKMGEFILEKFTWAHIASQWHAVFKS